MTKTRAAATHAVGGPLLARRNPSPTAVVLMKQTAAVSQAQAHSAHGREPSHEIEVKVERRWQTLMWFGRHAMIAAAQQQRCCLHPEAVYGAHPSRVTQTVPNFALGPQGAPWPAVLLKQAHKPCAPGPLNKSSSAVSAQCGYAQAPIYSTKQPSMNNRACNGDAASKPS